jgi:acyl transferase domain-containing protein/NAD(P)H-dependent flavin oxidoreductase YrpB (nitropropane dioxygenase family)/NADP-dependent 3-hydroxy acid dehydrogenase YdfG
MIDVEPIVGVTPFERPDTALVVAVSRAGALGVLDVVGDPGAAASALGDLSRKIRRFGVRVGEGFDAASLPQRARVVIVTAATEISHFPGRTVLAEVTCLEEARTAAHAGAHGLVAKGNESGGRVGAEPSFILLQRITRELPRLPVWAQGGVGLHSASACLVAGARGVVVDSQLALLKESSTPPEIARAVRAMDGSETRIVGGRRLHVRPPEPLEALAVGQDAAFARPFADGFGTVSALVSGLRKQMIGHVRQARAIDPLGPASKFAAEHGLRYPIAQGPMTRVSDTPAFADAVAGGGGLPFLALSLMRGAEARRVLDECAAMLAGRPWGVGVLGFVPPEIRDEQLALVISAKPTVALVAGGRPSHARPLEQAGIATYLHVPSPGLLDMFLRDGARRFVFEGRECGGHVGPRSSFVLWESAIERLLAENELEGVSVLFAGGIHDARSAAMVSAMAAPLAARGARIGVLMGTAYLFTEEAVTTGAILPAFQQEAIRCANTVLLETAPGHATRCVDSQYTRFFEEERRRLESSGQSRQEIWEALERLNLGRLRIAAKGLRREGDRLKSVDREEQLRDGMFMIGQVASLRDARCTVAELHEDVARGGKRWLDRAALPAMPRTGTDIAIVGMACIFPDAPNLGAFWKNIVLGANAIREVPKERWNPEQYFDPEGTGDATPSKWGGFLPETPFDPAAYGIPPRSLASIDPVQLLSLEVAKRALDDAGYGDRELDRERTSVVFGATSGTELANAYGFRALYPQFLGEMSDEMDRHLPRLTEDSFPGVLANVIAGRIANRLDLGGINYTVDAACASSLAAIDVACKELASGTSDTVIAGGADIHNSVNDYLMFASVHALSRTGQCRTFDASADGIVLGEGVAAVVLRRLEDAQRDGNRVYAVIKGVGGSSDGKSLALTAPRKEGQARALDRAYEAAGVSPADVGLVEAHGTGTVVGDKTELATLTEFFSTAGALPNECTLGSVKSNIGHTKCAAGLAGLIKTALAVHHGVLPPTLNLASPNPFYDAKASPFAFRASASPWTSATRLAGVSAFGFGGTNFHAVVASYEGNGARVGLHDWPAELFLFRSEDAIEATLVVLQKGDPHPLRDLSRSVCEHDCAQPVRLAVVAKNLDDLRAKLEAAREGKAAPGVFSASDRYGGDQVAFLFPGQGSQRPGMLADVFVAFPELRDLVGSDGGEKWLTQLFPPAAFTDADRATQKAAITDTRVAQPVLGIAGLAMARLLARFGVQPAMAGGHSYGELVALASAGALPEGELLALSEARANAILDATRGAPGTMAAVSAGPEAVREALAELEGVTIANHNAPDQTVIAGSEAAVASAIEALLARSIAARKIAVACAFHSPIVAEGAEAFAQRLEGVAFTPPRIPVYSNSTADCYPSDGASVRARLARQIATPVRFVEMIEAMYAAGARVFVEAGPGTVLSDLVARILKGRPHVTIRCDRSGVQGVEAFLSALAQLAAHGVTVDAAALFDGRGARAFDLASPPPACPPRSAWMVHGFGARPLEGELPDFAMRIPEAPLAPDARAPGAADREAALVEYLRGVREIVEGQRQVMMKYLGEPGADRPRVDPLADGAPISRDQAAAQRPPSLRAPKKARSTRPPPAPIRVDLPPLEALTAAVSERTGYPAEALDPDLDLEADLGIDSIKRIEILGQMRDALGFRSMSDTARSDALEELARLKTLREIARWIESRSNREDAPATTTPETASASPVLQDADVARYVLDVTSLPPAANGAHVEGLTFSIVPDRLGVATKLARLLEGSGARAKTIAPGEAIGDVDGVVYLDSLTPDSYGSLHALFSIAQTIGEGRARHLFAATGLGGSFGLGAKPKHPVGGISGLLKSVAKERPELRVRVVDLHPEEDAAQLAAHIHAELLCGDARVEVGYAGGVRQGVRAVEHPGPAEGPALSLDRNAVVLVTGGARGITAEGSVALAERFGCKLELVGRTPLGGAEDEETARADDAVQLRRLLLRRAGGAGPSSPAEIERACRAILASRDIRRTIARIEASGGSATYHALDVRDEAAFGSLIDAIYERHGRLDGVVHGAGVIEDRLIRQKTRESFERVFDTKVASALTLQRKLRDDVRFVVFFSSVSGAFGNRGQVDYAAANDALDKLAHHLAGKLRARVVSINWGPWGQVGMVSPELEREYARRGIRTIAPDPVPESSSTSSATEETRR